MIARLAAISVVVAACGPPPIPYPDLRGDAGPDTCSRACTALEGAGCPEGGWSPGGASCMSVCLGATVMLPVACVAESGGNVEIIRKCGVRCAR